VLPFSGVVQFSLVATTEIWATPEKGITIYKLTEEACDGWLRFLSHHKDCQSLGISVDFGWNCICILPRGHPPRLSERIWTYGYCGRHQVPNQFETAMLCPRRLRGALIGRYRGHSNTNVSGYLRHPFRETARRVCHFCPFLPSLALFGVKARTGFVCCLSCCLAALEHYSTPVCDVVREVLRKKSQFLWTCIVIR